MHSSRVFEIEAKLTPLITLAQEGSSEMKLKTQNSSSYWSNFGQPEFQQNTGKWVTNMNNYTQTLRSLKSSIHTYGVQLLNEEIEAARRAAELARQQQQNARTQSVQKW
ncbi:hypothetical protein EJP82_25915 [Paenibacillus anaericanus]|uniref:WXG100 family type VII secretion target n=1 Tax=Paenibacillus anaericanus TaxID=170367 RepID=A0A3S1E7C6_9BACL|nr:hypothetical protein [Paenibacillus anaericanus]RUT39519.1 hypothetical protein EJP82_25915 [Paenibacillus anaericanus]